MVHYRQYIQLVLVFSSILFVAAYPAEKNKKECSSSNEPDIPDRRADKTGAGGLFFKHLRFRAPGDNEEKEELLKELGLWDDKSDRKRGGSLSVSALADMLSNMRQRQQSGGGVRMQTLRFGRK